MSIPLEGVVIDAASTRSSTSTQLEEVEGKPWKYIGYKDLVSYMALDSDFFAARRFDRLHIRLILTLQDQLVELESRLDGIDRRYSSTQVKIHGANPPVIVEIPPDKSGQGVSPTTSNRADEHTVYRDINNGTVRDDMPQRASLVAEIRLKMAEYDKAILDYAAVRSLAPAPRRNVSNIKAWFEDHTGAIMEDETAFIKHDNELVSVSLPKSVARQWFEQHIVYSTRATLGLFKRTPHAHSGSRATDQVYLIDDTAVDTSASIAIFVMVVVMLITPLWILQTLQEMQSKLVVITIFIVMCQAFLTAGTLGRPFERLAATAGYSAVLMVFLQVGNS